jgi:hypothetical protein
MKPRNVQIAPSDFAPINWRSRDNELRIFCRSHLVLAKARVDLLPNSAGPIVLHYNASLRPRSLLENLRLRICGEAEFAMLLDRELQALSGMFQKPPEKRVNAGRRQRWPARARFTPR